MKKRLSLALSFVLLLGIILSLNSCETFKTTATLIGEIKHVRCHGVTADPELQEYYIYVQPYGREDNAHWEYFTVSCKTDTESEYSPNLSEMPELAVGNVVEIEYYKNRGKNSIEKNRYGVAAINSIDNTENIEAQDNIELKLNKKFSYTKPDGGIWEVKGTVLYVAKVEAPLSGYFVYFDGTTPFVSSFQCYWVGINAETGATPNEVFERLEAGEVGYTIEFDVVSNQHPFENYSAEAIFNISIVEE